MENKHKNSSEGEGQGAFNMAISTLMRIDKILQELKEISSAPIPDGIKQEVKLNLVKSFYLNSAPLLKKEVREGFNWILEQRPDIRKELSNNSSDRIETGNKRTFFNEELELKLDTLILDIQIALQEEGDYLMAGKKDIRFSWKAD